MYFADLQYLRCPAVAALTCGSRPAGSTRATPTAGSSGTAGSTSAAAPRTTSGRSAVGGCLHVCSRGSSMKEVINAKLCNSHVLQIVHMQSELSASALQAATPLHHLSWSTEYSFCVLIESSPSPLCNRLGRSCRAEGALPESADQQVREAEEGGTLRGFAAVVAG